MTLCALGVKARKRGLGGGRGAKGKGKALVKARPRQAAQKEEAKLAKWRKLIGNKHQGEDGGWHVGGKKKGEGGGWGQTVRIGEGSHVREKKNNEGGPGRGQRSTKRKGGTGVWGGKKMNSQQVQAHQKRVKIRSSGKKGGSSGVGKQVKKAVEKRGNSMSTTLKGSLTRRKKKKPKKAQERLTFGQTRTVMHQRKKFKAGKESREKSKGEKAKFLQGLSATSSFLTG